MALTETKNRKDDHIRICIEKDIQARFVKTGLEEVFLIHRALPEISLDEVDTSIKFLNHRLEAPIVIEAMTGGTDRASIINANLAKAAESLGLAMGVGSQRVAIEDPRLEASFKVVREKAPHAFLIGNLGATQITGGHGFRDIQKAIKMIEADAFAIHVNPLQEAVQPEGNTSFGGVLEAITEITSSLSIPIIIKETGAGIAFEEAKLLKKAGVKGVDISGVGGTSWAAVESFRVGNLIHARLGKVFWDWGIPTTVSVVEVSQITELAVIASGGIRTGIDATKALALGAEAIGVALPLLKPALEGKVEKVLKMLIEEIKTAMFLVGIKKVEDLVKAPLVITGITAEWLRNRGFEPEKYSMRRITK